KGSPRGRPKILEIGVRYRHTHNQRRRAVKQCPVCRRTYFDESLSYCLSDGTLLNDMGGSAEQATFVRPTEDATVVRSHSGTPAPGVATTAPKSSGGMKFAIAGLAGVVVLLIFVVLVLVGVMWMRGRAETANTNSNGNANLAGILPGSSPSSSP